MAILSKLRKPLYYANSEMLVKDTISPFQGNDLLPSNWKEEILNLFLQW